MNEDAHSAVLDIPPLPCIVSRVHTWIYLGLPILSCASSFSAARTSLVRAFLSLSFTVLKLLLLYT